MHHQDSCIDTLIDPPDEKFDVAYNPYYLSQESSSPAVHPIDAHPASSFILLGKLKSSVNEVLYSLGSAGNTYDVNDYISVTEECLKELKNIKLGRQIESRRANIHKHLTVCSPIILELHDDSHREESPQVCTPIRSQSVLKNHISAIMRQKKLSPKASPFVSDEITRDNIEDARHASALRNEERQRQAEERRLYNLNEIKIRLEAAEARGQRAKARREAAEQRQREETMDRQENAVRRIEEARKQTVERAQRAHSHVDEVRLTNELRRQTKVLLLDKKMSEVGHNQEVKREAQERRAQERREAMSAAAKRRRDLSEERAEKQQLRDLQRQEILRRLEEQKRLELELKQQKAEEWEKRVQQRQEEVHAEMEALSRKAEEKFQQSQQILEEQREKRRQKLEREDQKQREAKSRRDREGESKTMVHETMAFICVQKDDEMPFRVSKLVLSSSRQGKAFSDNYQKECLISTKDLNRSKLRVAFSRLSTFLNTTSVVQCKQPLHDISALDLCSIDYEFIRYFNSFEIIAGLITSARRARDVAVVQQATSLLRRLFVDEVEGKQNVIYFLRSGDLVPLLLESWEEATFLRQHNNPSTNADIILSILEVVGTCLEQVCFDNQSKIAPLLNQILNDLDITGVDRICFSIIKTPSIEAELNLTHCALRILYAELNVISRYRNESRTLWFQHVTASFFSLLQNTVLADKNPSQPERSLSGAQVVVLFSALRVLNMLARWQLSAFQNLLSEAITSVTATSISESNGGALIKDNTTHVADLFRPLQITRMELFHVLNGFFAYIQEHVEDLEVIPPNAGSSAPSTAKASSYEDALRVGITLTRLPTYLFPSPASRGANGYIAEEYKPGGKRYPLRAALHECILLVGYLCLDNPFLQEMISWGKGKTLIGNMLSFLPIHYFSSARHILFPTILCLICENNQIIKFIQDEMELKALHSFLFQEYENLSKKAKSYAQTYSQQLEAYRSKVDAQCSVVNTSTKIKGKCSTETVHEDQDILDTTPRSTNIGETSPFLEKERLCKLLRTCGVSSDPSFYRIERRLPISYWPGILNQLEQFLN
ncbi:unnamed protein product [Phytomonas sp. Hart1]|nr:unnamed protein product [Phytomonas sp. Hart1]|eukprot:CCW67513.1 unnamed protein product [Phytomonas sp. isolate Hart1]